MKLWSKIKLFKNYIFSKITLEKDHDQNINKFNITVKISEEF